MMLIGGILCLKSSLPTVQRMNWQNYNLDYGISTSHADVYSSVLKILIRLYCNTEPVNQWSNEINRLKSQNNI